MADTDLMPMAGVPFRVLVDANGVAVGGTSTIMQLASRGMRAVCSVSSAGVSGSTDIPTLASRGIRAVCLVDANGLASDSTPADALRRAGIRPVVSLTSQGLSGSTTMLQLAQRGLEYVCLVDENGAASGTLPYTTEGFGVWGDTGPAKPTAFAAATGHPIDIPIVFFNNTSWTNFINDIPFETNLWTGYNCCWSVPLVPTGGTFAEVIAGTRDSVFTTCATSTLAAAPSGKKIIIRLGWEFNGTWFGWAAAGNEANYVSAFNRVVGLFKAVSNRFVFDLCINYSDGGSGCNVSTVVSGVQSNLTFLGNDLYWSTGDATSNGGGDAFGNARDKAWGLAATRSYALANGLLYSMPEVGSPDSVPAFGQQTYDWIYANVPAYWGWWEGDHGTLNTRLATGVNPLTLAQYKLHFGVPQITTSATQSSIQNVAAVIPLTVAYPQTITWTVTSGTASIAGSTLTIPGAPASTVNVTVQATNQWGLSSTLAITQTFTAPYTFVNTEASAFAARFTNSVSETQKSYLDAFWTAIKAGPISASNLMAKADSFGFGFIDSQVATLNAKSAAYGTIVPMNAPTYLAGQGYQGAFTGVKYLNMGITFNRSGNVYTANSATLGAWEFANIQTGSGILGNDNIGCKLITRNGGNMSGILNGFGTGPSAVIADARGFTAVTRNSASAEQLYKNGLSVATTTTGDAAGGVTGDTLYGMGTNTSFPDAHVMGAWWMGSSLTVNEHKDLYNAFRNLMVSFGVITAGSFPIAT